MLTKTVSDDLITALRIWRNRMSALAQFNPNSFDELTRFAEMVSRTQAIPQAYQGKPDDIVATVIMGADLGLSPMQSLQNIAVIRGKPTVWGDGLLAICQSHPNFSGITECRKK